MPCSSKHVGRSGFKKWPALAITSAGDQHNLFALLGGVCQRPRGVGSLNAGNIVLVCASTLLTSSTAVCFLRPALEMGYFCHSLPSGLAQMSTLPEMKSLSRKAVFANPNSTLLRAAFQANEQAVVLEGFWQGAGKICQAEVKMQAQLLD